MTAKLEHIDEITRSGNQPSDHIDECQETSVSSPFLLEHEINTNGRNIGEMYPLPIVEKIRLTVVMVANNALFLAIAGIIIGVCAALSAGNLFFEAVNSFSSGMDNYLTATFLVALSIAAIICIHLTSNRFSQRYRDDMLNDKQGINGELMRLPLFISVPLLFLVGISEELLFRYALPLGLCSIAGFLTSESTALFIIAEAIIAVLFTLGHTNYKSFASRLQVLILAGGMACLFALSGSIVVTGVAHGLYDCIAVLNTRHDIVKKTREGKNPYEDKAPARLLSGNKEN